MDKITSLTLKWSKKPSGVHGTPPDCLRVAECAPGEEMSSKDWQSDGCGHDSRTADCYKGNALSKAYKGPGTICGPQKSTAPTMNYQT